LARLRPARRASVRRRCRRRHLTLLIKSRAGSQDKPDTGAANDQQNYVNERMLGGNWLEIRQ
jgi:hypothetical protein